MNEVLHSDIAAKTLREGGKVDVGDLGFLTARRHQAIIFDFPEDCDEYSSYRATKARYIVTFTPSRKLRENLS